jgi:ribosome-binding protein aMBF1 (putative translation factor)
MGTSIAHATTSRHRLNLDDPRPSMAKASIKNLDERDYRAEIGAALARMRMLCGLTGDQLASEIGKEPAQVSRWERGTERPQFDAYVAVERFRFPLLVALAGVLDAEVRTEISARRTA